MHQVLRVKLHTSRVEGSDFSDPDFIKEFVTNPSWTAHKTFHSVLKSMPGVATCQRDMLFVIHYNVDWNKLENVGKGKDTAVPNMKKDTSRP